MLTISPTKYEGTTSAGKVFFVVEGRTETWETTFAPMVGKCMYSWLKVNKTNLGDMIHMIHII